MRIIRNWSVFLFLVLPLSGCLEDDKPSVDIKFPDAQEQTCFDIISQPGHAYLVSVLINRCTGETWVAQFWENSGKDGKKDGTITYVWLKMDAYDSPNNFTKPKYQ